MRCTRLSLAVCLLTLTTLSPDAFAEPSGSTGRVAFHVVGRNQVIGVTGPESGTAVAFGYMTAIDGISQSLFSDSNDVGEATAHFTFRSDDYAFTTIDNGNSKVRFRQPGS